MKHYSFSDMNRLSGEILEHALGGPVALTKYGKEKLVIVTAERYRQLTGHTSAAAFTVEAAPDDIHRELMHGLDAIIAAEATDA